MLENILRIARIVCYSCLAFAGLSIGIFILQSRSVLVGLKNDEDEAHRVLLESALTAKEARLASTEERKFLSLSLPILSKQIGGVLTSTTATMRGLDADSAALKGLIVQVGDNTTMLSADGHQTLTALQNNLEELSPIEEKLNNTVRDTDLLITSPEVKDTLVNVDKSTQSMARAMDHTDKAAADIQVEVHNITHPKILSRVLSFAVNASRFIRF